MAQNKDYVVVNIPTFYSLPSSPTYNFSPLSLSPSPSPSQSPNSIPSPIPILNSSNYYNLDFPIQSYTNLTKKRRIHNRYLYSIQTNFYSKNNSEKPYIEKNINNDCFINIENFENFENINFEDENSISKYKNQSKISKCSSIIRNIIGIQKTSNVDNESMNV